MRVDLHCHTCYSRDSLTTYDKLLHGMDRCGLGKVAITDHNVITGALDFYARAPDRFLVGEEIRTTHGELIALFIEERIPPGLSPQDTIARVHAQGGLIGASHPLDRLRSEALGRRTLEAIHEQLDFLEVFNARISFARDNRLTRELAARWGLPGSAGSDAHAPSEVGRAYIEIPPFDDPASFLDSLAQGQIGGRLSGPWVHFFSTYAKWRRRLGVQ